MCRQLAAIMFLRCKVRRKDGKQHRYWSVVENTRVARGRVVQRHALYLGEINVWLMDRGVPTDEVLAEMRAADPPVHYLVGTPKGRLTRLEKHLTAQPWQQARPGVQVKLLAQEGELYVLAQSRDRVAKERAMRRRQLKR